MMFPKRDLDSSTRTNTAAVEELGAQELAAVDGGRGHGGAHPRKLGAGFGGKPFGGCAGR